MERGDSISPAKQLLQLVKSTIDGEGRERGDSISPAKQLLQLV
jgi:hypothetical protein